MHRTLETALHMSILVRREIVTAMAVVTDMRSNSIILCEEDRRRK